MLSVQQLSRVLRVIVSADALRVAAIPNPGASFTIGYLVGGGGTPNNLFWRSGWWPGIEHTSDLDAKELKRRRLVAACPTCGDRDSIRLRPSVEDVRIYHVCGVCNHRLPLYMTDDEVFRYQPSVIISTVDKITGYAHYGEFTSFSRGPAYRCPDHGYFSFGKCLARRLCSRSAKEMEAVTEWLDPVPSISIQDELHLVREELGTFTAHFEGVLTELQVGGPSRLPTKVLAATATIEEYGDQLRHVYGRRPRRFPSPGFDRKRGFYTQETSDTRRFFLGVMPTGGGTSKVEVAGRLQVAMIEVVKTLQDDLPTARAEIHVRCGVVLSDTEVAELLFAYEVSLAYVNSRAHGANIADDLRELARDYSEAGDDNLNVEMLTGDVPISELASAIDRIEDATLDTPRGERLRAMVGTSVVSHGVDIDRLNILLMTGMPATVADYIQASSRSGRSHVGLVITAVDHFSRREASIFSNFISTHRFLDRMVEPVPVNRYAHNAIHRTLPAVVMSLLWDLARMSELDPPRNGIRWTREFQPWWNARGPEIEILIRERLDRAYRASVVAAADRALEDAMVERVLRRWRHTELPQLTTFVADRTKDLFRERVMTSLRDVDEAVSFGATPRSTPIYEALTYGGR